MEFKVNNSADSCGAGIAGYVDASYADLVRAFGEPAESDGYKVSTEWTFEAPDGRVVTLRDYKETNLFDSDLPSVDEFRALPSYRWRVGSDGILVAAFAEWLRGQLAVGDELNANGAIVAPSDLPGEAPLAEKESTALRVLADALSMATDTGVLDYLMRDVVDPDSINDVCDAVDVALNRATVTRSQAPCAAPIEEEPMMTLDDIEDERDAVESSTPLVEDATELREALVDLFERSDEFEFPQITRLSSFEDAMIMTRDEGNRHHVRQRQEVSDHDRRRPALVDGESETQRRIGNGRGNHSLRERTGLRAGAVRRCRRAGIHGVAVRPVPKPRRLARSARPGRRVRGCWHPSVRPGLRWPG